MLCNRISSKGPDDFFLFVDDEIEFECQSCEASCIHNLFIKGISVEEDLLCCFDGASR